MSLFQLLWQVFRWYLPSCDSAVAGLSVHKWHYRPSYPLCLIINGFLRSELIVYCLAALGCWQRCRWGCQRSGRDLEIAGNPQPAAHPWISGCARTSQCLWGFCCAVKSHRENLSRLVKDGWFIGHFGFLYILHYFLCDFVPFFLSFIPLFFFFCICSEVSYGTGWVIILGKWKLGFVISSFQEVLAGYCFGCVWPVFWCVVASYCNSWLTLQAQDLPASLSVIVDFSQIGHDFFFVSPPFLKTMGLFLDIF